MNQEAKSINIKQIAQDNLVAAEDYWRKHIRPVVENSNDIYYRAPLPGDLAGSVDKDQSRQEKGLSCYIAGDHQALVNNAHGLIYKILLGAEKQCHPIPVHESLTPLAQQFDEYVEDMLFRRVGDFQDTVRQATKSALINGIGVAHVYWHSTAIPREVKYKDMTAADILTIREQIPPDVQWTDDMTPIEAEGEEDGEEKFDYTLTIYYPKEEPKIEYVSSSQLIADPLAETVKDARLFGFHKRVRISELVEQGYDYDTLCKHSNNYSTTNERRNELEEDYVNNSQDKSNDPIDVAETYQYIDAEGLGVATLFKVISVGEDHEVLEIEEFPCMPFVEFIAIREPGAKLFKNSSLISGSVHEHFIKTDIMRSGITALGLECVPRRGYVEGLVKETDLMNFDPGALVPMDDPGATWPIDEGQSSQSAMQWLDVASQEFLLVNGITAQSQGINPKDLQSTTPEAIEAITSAATGRVETIAKSFTLSIAAIYELAAKVGLYANDKELQRYPELNIEALELMTFRMSLSPTSKQQLQQGWMAVITMMRELIAEQGPVGPLTGLPQLSNALQSWTKAHGIDDANLFNKLPPDWQPPQPPPPQPDPMMEAQLAATQATAENLQASAAQKEAKMQIDQAKLALDEEKLDAQLDGRL